MDTGFHFHRLDGQKQVAGFDLLTHRRPDRGNNPRHRRSDVIDVADLGLGTLCSRRFDHPVGHAHHARLAIQFKKDFNVAVFIGLAQGLQTNFQRLARVDFRGDLFARLHPVEKGAGRQYADRAIGPVTPHVI